MTETEFCGFFLGNRHRIRVSILLLSMFFQLGVLTLGSTVSLTSDEVNEILESFPPVMSWEVIVLHNMRVTLFSFLPLFGVWWTGFVGFNTGIAMKAIGITVHQSTTHLFFTIAGLPHYWFENFAYSIALTAGLMFLLALLTLRRSAILYEANILIASLTAWAVLLLFASILEAIPMFMAFMLWVIIIPLFVSVLEMTSAGSFGCSRKAIYSVILFLYFSFFCISLPIAMYVLLGYYLFETLTNGWLRSQIQIFSLSRRKHSK